MVLTLLIFFCEAIKIIKSYYNKMTLCLFLLLLCTKTFSSTILANATHMAGNFELGSNITPVNTISANQTLSGNQTIISSGGNFELGFFSPSNSSKFYIGIWYKKVWKQTIVWVANRETPISDKNSAYLKILDGNLVLLNESQIKIWSTDVNSTTPTNSTIAVLQDNGNLVLRLHDSSSSQPLWESFNNPTDTWMPQAKFGYDKRTQKKQIPTCWKNFQDPAAGLFSIEFDPNGREFVTMWNGSEQYWTSGSWNGRIFNQVPEMHNSFGKYNVSYVDNENESYFIYSDVDPSVMSRFIMDSSGQMKHLRWSDNMSWILYFTQPRQQCDVYAYCGPFSTCNEGSLPFCNCLPGYKVKSDSDWILKDYSGGCVREINLQCENNDTISNRRKDKFIVNSNVRLPKDSQSLIVGSTGECEFVCLSNCSCTAYAYDENGCLIWNGELLDLEQLAEGDGGGKTIHIKLSSSSSVFAGTKNHKWILIGATVRSIAVVLVFLAIILVSSRQRQQRGTSKVVEGFLVAFRFKDLQIATKNFSDKLGGGGFGSVFKGTLPDSTIIAVKKLERITQGEKQFRTEVSAIGIIQHVNLVRLRGFCVEGNKKLLVYEYMSNGSLNSHLFNAKKSKVLMWKTRYQIALGIARGLAYLHENCNNCIIHCDIKPENILLDAEFCAKVADFGLAKLVGHDFSRVLTTMRGTIGYLAPEWMLRLAITSKADVYSFGMMLFELISGKRNSTNLNDGNNRYFPYLAAKMTIDGGDILELLDPILDGNADVSEVSKICKIACWCIQGDENVRPSMDQVVQILEGLINVNLPPIPRWLEGLIENAD